MEKMLYLYIHALADGEIYYYTRIYNNRKVSSNHIILYHLHFQSKITLLNFRDKMKKRSRKHGKRKAAEITKKNKFLPSIA